MELDISDFFDYLEEEEKFSVLEHISKKQQQKLLEFAALKGSKKISRAIYSVNKNLDLYVPLQIASLHRNRKLCRYFAKRL